MDVQLIYVSDNYTEKGEIEEILEKSRKNNANLEITGILLYTEDNFLQCLEGDYTKVMSLYDKIKADKRHGNVRLISLHSIEKRDFPNWAMGEKKIALEIGKLEGNLNSEEKEKFNDILKGYEDTQAIELIKKLI